MRQSIIVPAFGAVLMARASGAQEHVVRIKDAPVSVINNVTSRFPQARIAGVTTETEDGKQVYEVTLTERNRTIDVMTTADGQITVIEREISAGRLPATVAKLLREKYPRATYKRVEAVNAISGSDETLSFYEVLLVDATKRWFEVQIVPDGSRILKVEKKKAGDTD